MDATLLIIEDDQDLCFLLETFLSRKGYEVEIARTGQEGINKYEETGHDVVLCDFKLEDYEGIDVLKKLKEIDPTVIFITITGHSDVKVAVDMMRMGASDYLTKPLVPEDLLKLLEKVTEG